MAPPDQVNAPIRRLVSSEAKSNERPRPHQRRIRASQEVFEKKREKARTLTDRHVPMTEWRTTLKILLKHSSQKPEDHVRGTKVFAIRFPRTAKDHKFDPNRLIRIIDLQTTSRGYFLPSAQGLESSKQHIALHGCPEDLSYARKILQSTFRTVSEVSEDEAERLLQNTPPASVRSAFNEDYKNSTRRARQMLAEIKTPEVMSTISFAAYIQDLICSDPPKMKFKTFKGEHADNARDLGEHIDQVSEVLVALFDIRRLSPCWSTRAIEAAIKYLGKHRHLPQARSILIRLRNLGAIKHSAVYESFLDTAASAEDLHNFQFGLQVMIENGFSPTWRSWAMLMRLLRYWDLSAAEHVYKIMQANHLLSSNAAKKAVIEDMSDIWYRNWVMEGGSPTSFLEHCDQQTGIKLELSTGMVDRMLGVHTRRNEWDQAEHILDLAVSNGVRISPRVLETLNTSALTYRNLDFPIKALEKVRCSRHPLILTAKSFAILLKLALATCHLNTFRVIWRYACMHGEVTHDMRHIMGESLVAAPVDSTSLTPPTPPRLRAGARTREQLPKPAVQSLELSKLTRSARREIFMQYAAALAIALKSDDVDKPLSAVTETPVALQPRQIRRKVMEEDMELGDRYHPVSDISEILRRAYETDQVMHRQQLPNDLRALQAYCIPIPVSEKRMFKVALDEDREYSHIKTSVRDAKTTDVHERNGKEMEEVPNAEMKGPFEDSMTW